MKAFSEAFHVAQPQSTVWERLRLPAAAVQPRPEPGASPVGIKHGGGALSPTALWRVPGFPSEDGQSGCLGVVLASKPQAFLKLRKADGPCIDSEIEIAIGPANASGWPTRVVLTQSGLPAPLLAMPDMASAHWRQIVADFRLHLEHGVAAPGFVWGTTFGAIVTQAPAGLLLGKVDDDGFAHRCGLSEGDLLLTFRGVRIGDIGQLWTALALFRRGEQATVTWVRRGELLAGSALL